MEEKLTKAQEKEKRKQERREFEARIKQQESREKFKKIGLWTGGLAILMLGVWGMITLVNQSTQSATPNLTAPAISKTDLSFGPKTSSGSKIVTLIEYADFQCPSCGFAYPMVKQLLKDYNGRIRYIYRFFPLTQIHQNAMISAKAGYGAHLQGKFLEMEDLLFTNQNAWANQSDADARNTFDGYARQLGLNLNKFHTDIDAKTTQDFINKETDSGINAGVNATPTFFVNGKFVTNPGTYDEFKQDIDHAMK